MIKNNHIPESMMAAVCAKPGAALEIRTVGVPQPASGEILVKLESCGICHSDIHLRDGQEGLPDDLYPLILGHEGIGRVVQHGPHCDAAPSIGSRVGLPWLYDTCLDCKPCLSGHETFCQIQNARGINRHGAFAEYAVADFKYAPVMPEDINPFAAAPLLCAGLTAWAALKKTRIGPESHVLIIGAGGLGQYATAIAKKQGARVMVIDQHQSKLDTAQKLGADELILAGPKAGEMVNSYGGADVIVNFAPTAAVWGLIETVANPMSDIVAVALVHQPVDLSMMWLIDGGHRVFGSSVGTRQEMRDFLEFAARYSIEVNVETTALSEIDGALDRLKKGDVAGRLCIDFAK
jgi:propanol-preferring alcohol dehydrogenase